MFCNKYKKKINADINVTVQDKMLIPLKKDTEKTQENNYLNYKFDKYLEMIRLIDDYKPKMKSKHNKAVVSIMVLFFLLTVASIFSKALDSKYAFFGGAFLALTYKLLDMMNTDAKTVFDKKTAYIDKLIDINFELDKNGQPSDKRKLTIESLVKNIVKTDSKL
ncbi:hypothetical protein DIS12_06010 [Leuconostoc citreum]|uniref:hypothetical protein n=1 Tax=Leuconostoc citreum TaxID=33964 RepID=UPI0011213438|nr:hypothetical protein [Leuconostoc citreum]TOY71003.1 hypothetical protein DIS12_06010 [Leuconostoc citreum]